MTLPQKLLELHRAFDTADVPHAFGGAIALAYWTLDPRGTSDIDVNLFWGTDRVGEVLDALPSAVERDARTLAAVRRDGQVRVWWDDTPLDLFLDTAEIHTHAARHRRMVPFAGAEIPVLGPIELACFKALFDRTKDWADIEAMVAAETLDVDAVRDVLGGMLGAGDPRFARLDDAVERAARERP